MAKPKFPTPMHHPKTGGETTAATESSFRVLAAKGWQTGPKPDSSKKSSGSSSSS